MDVGSLLVPDSQPTKLVEPGKGPLHDPSPAAEATAVLGVAHREQRQDAPVAQTSTD